ncbi:MAG TPA: EAL domain-containing protein [Sphingomonas sp.]|nr:EAL domain-containing protein [Sphingomonas sp.]
MQVASISRGKSRTAVLARTGGFPSAEIPDIDPVHVGVRQRYLDAIHIPAAVVVLEDGEPRIAACNAPFQRVGGEEADGEQASGLVNAVGHFLEQGQDRVDLEWRQPGIGGRSFRLHMSRLSLHFEHERRALVTLVDRTAEVETERSLRAEMLHDSLTGLPNRLAFGEAIEEAIEGGGAVTNFAILAVDLNRFSRVNECVGALAGDELIITVARRLVSALRDGDMLARMAGDEFGVLLRNTEGPDDVLSAAARLQAALSTPIRLSELEIRIDCSIGGASWEARIQGSGDLLRNAQVALKRAKLSGQIESYRPGEANHARRRFSLETELRRAIEQDQLSLAFQPLIHLQTGAVSGFEALARWDHADQGQISPVEFISVAEESGLIVPLGRWALDATARTLGAWDRQAGGLLPLKLCVNVSPVQLARDTVAEAVKSTLQHNHIDGHRMTLELTESSIVGDPERANRVLRALHDLGCRVAMDDFGTGYSSLAYLQKLPIDILKIDRSFVTDMHENSDSVAIIRAILSLARALGMSTTAEGIETAETERTLANLGCDTGQGYHFARPLTADAALEYYQAHKA